MTNCPNKNDVVAKPQIMITESKISPEQAKEVASPPACTFASTFESLPSPNQEATVQPLVDLLTLTTPMQSSSASSSSSSGRGAPTYSRAVWGFETHTAARTVFAVMDTGASETLVSASLWHDLRGYADGWYEMLDRPIEVVTGTGAIQKITHRICFSFSFRDVPGKSFVTALVVPNLLYEFILGRDFLGHRELKFSITSEFASLRWPKAGGPHTRIPLTHLLCSTLCTDRGDREILGIHTLCAELAATQASQRIDLEDDPPTPLFEEKKSEGPGLTDDEISAIMESPPARQVLVMRTNVPNSQSDQPALAATSAVSNKGDSAYVLSDGERERWEQMKKKYHDVFSEDLLNSAARVRYAHRIDVGENPPVKQTPYRVPPSTRQAMNMQVKDMLEKGVVRPSESPWASPVVMPRKADGTRRFCVDLRAVNKLTKKDSYPLPLPSDYLSALEGAKYFSVMDLRSGFWQIPLHEESKPITAFVTPDGLYEFNVLPFGLSNSPAAFQRMMDSVLGSLKFHGALVYIDDILIYSASVKEHFVLLEQVFERLVKANLKVKESKCKFWMKTVRYLGHLVSPEGISPAPELTQSISTFPYPKKLKELRSFLGLTSYYRKFIPGYAKITEPLRALLRKDAPFLIKEEHRKAVDQLKSILMSAPILRHPNYHLPFIIQTDASDEGVAAVLSQKDARGDEYAVACVSRGLSTAEKKWTTLEKEALALVYATAQFAPFLGDKHFTVETDSGSLSWLLNGDKKGKLARWATRLQGLDFTVKHRKGKANANADAFSRVPAEYQPVPHESDDELEPYLPVRESKNDKATILAVNVVDTGGTDNKENPSSSPVEPSDDWLSSLKADEIKTSVGLNHFRHAQEADDEVMPLVRFFIKGTLPPNAADGYADTIRSKYTFQEGVLCKNVAGEPRIVVPKGLRQKLMVAYHRLLLCHAGSEKTLGSMSKLFYWQGMSKEVKDFVTSCEACQKSKKTPPTHAGLLQPRHILMPFDVIHVDFFGPIRPSADGNRFILTVVDAYTRWPILIPLPNSLTETLSMALWDQVYSVHGCPVRVVSDQGPQFMSELYEELHRVLGIKLSHSSPYHPQGISPAERIHRYLKASLQMLGSRTQDDWDVYISSVEFAYRVTPLSGMKYSPFQLLYGREPKLPIDVLFAPSGVVQLSVDDMIERMCRNLAQSRKDIDVAQRQQREKQKAHYDASRYPVSFQPGDLVLLNIQERVSGLTTKLIPAWKGPFKVVKQLSPVNYLIDLGSGKQKVFHVQRISAMKISSATQVSVSPKSPPKPVIVPPSSYAIGDMVVFLEKDVWKLGKVEGMSPTMISVWKYGHSAVSLDYRTWKFFPAYVNDMGEERYTISILPEPWERVIINVNPEQILLEKPQFTARNPTLSATTMSLIQDRWMTATSASTSASRPTLQQPVSALPKTLSGDRQ